MINNFWESEKMKKLCRTMKKGEMLTNIYLNFILVIVYYEEKSRKY